MKKINKAEKARTDQDLERQKKMWIARGEIIFSDDLFKSLTGKQRDDIINVEVGERDRENWTTQAWWKGMTITERKDAFRRIFLLV